MENSENFRVYFTSFLYIRDNTINKLFIVMYNVSVTDNFRLANHVKVKAQKVI